MRIVTKVSQNIPEDCSLQFLWRIPGAEYHVGEHKTSIQFNHNGKKYNVPPSYALLSIAMYEMAKFSEGEQAKNQGTGYIIRNIEDDGTIAERAILKRLTHGLFATDAEVAKISHAGIRAIFKNYNLDTTVNHFLNDCKYRSDIVELTLKSRFEPTVNAKMGFDEDTVREINEQIYQEEKDDMEKAAGGSLSWNRLYLSVLGQRVAERLEEATGWRFQYREVEDVYFDEEMIEIFRCAYPHFAIAVDDTIDMLRENRKQEVDSDFTNPIEKLEYRKYQYHKETQAMIEMLGDFPDGEEIPENSHTYYTILASQFVVKYYKAMGRDTTEGKIRNTIAKTAREIADYILARLHRW